MNFSNWLRTADGRERSKAVRKGRKQVVADITNKFVNPHQLQWKSLLDEGALLHLNSELKKREVGVKGRLGKLKRLHEAHRYTKSFS